MPGFVRIVPYLLLSAKGDNTFACHEYFHLRLDMSELNFKLCRCIPCWLIHSNSVTKKWGWRRWWAGRRSRQPTFRQQTDIVTEDGHFESWRVIRQLLIEDVLRILPEIWLRAGGVLKKVERKWQHGGAWKLRSLAGKFETANTLLMDESQPTVDWRLIRRASRVILTHSPFPAQPRPTHSALCIPLSCIRTIFTRFENKHLRNSWRLKIVPIYNFIQTPSKSRQSASVVTSS